MTTLLRKYSGSATDGANVGGALIKRWKNKKYFYSL
jgi:hypothetical protein